MMAAGDIYRVVFNQYSAAVGLMQNVIHFRAQKANSSPQDLINHFVANFAEQWRGHQCNNVTYGQSFCYQIVPIALDAAMANGPIQAGSRGGEGLPGFCAVILQIKTGFARRTAKGRLFFGGISEMDQLNGVISGATKADWDAKVPAIFGPYLGTIPTSGYNIGVWSRKIGNSTTPPNPEGFTIATSVAYSLNLGIMSKRKLGVGV